MVQAITNHGKVDAAAVIQSAEYSVGAILAAREGGGIGYRPYNLGAADVDALISQHFESGKTRPLVFTARSRPGFESPLGSMKEPELAFAATSSAKGHATSMQVVGDDESGNFYSLYVDRVIRTEQPAARFVGAMPNQIEFRIAESTLRNRNLNSWLGTFPRQVEFDGFTQKSKIVVYTHGSNILHTSSAEYVNSIVNNQVGLIGKGGRRQTGY
jgi:hypothetical protein